MSGEKSFEILNKIFKPIHKKDISKVKGYTMQYGHIYDGEKIIDEVLVSYFKAPKSYTTEDMCEINSHGGNIVMRKILEICLKNGAELAEPGEFTKRAFLNGRIDLSQAESVIDIINAKSEREAKTGIKQLEGSLSNEIAKIKQEILDVMVNVDVSIDYPEYDVEDVTNSQISEMLDSVQKKLETLEKSFDNGKLIKEGIKTAIIGKPNAGKSSLLNAILKEDRAIVTEYEGTTRDTIEEFVNIDGVPLKLIDTAGIRDAKDEVEKIGIEKAREQLKHCDFCILILDRSREIEEEDKILLKEIESKKAVILYNKSDLENAFSIDEIENMTTKKIIAFSAKTGEGLEELQQYITNQFFQNEISFNQEIYLSNERQKQAVSEAYESLLRVKESYDLGVGEDFYTIDMMNAYEQLGSIIGETVDDDLVDTIFSDFCMGK